MNSKKVAENNLEEELIDRELTDEELRLLYSKLNEFDEERKKLEKTFTKKDTKEKREMKEIELFIETFLGLKL